MWKKRIPRISLLCFSLVLALRLEGTDLPTRAEFEALLERVEKLESALAYLQLDIVSEDQVDMQAEGSKGALLDNVIRVIHTREDNINYPWMDPQLWQTLKPGQSSEDVVEILGEPTLDEPSLHKRIDNVFTYKGKQVSTGKKITGVVRFYRNKITNIEPPKI